MIAAHASSSRLKIECVPPELNPEMDSFRVGTMLEMVRAETSSPLPFPSCTLQSPTSPSSFSSLLSLTLTSPSPPFVFSPSPPP
eukprot:756855-Hanusia_phi.AAC.1